MKKIAIANAYAFVIYIFSYESDIFYSIYYIANYF